MSPIQTSKVAIDESIICNLVGKRKKRKPKYNIGFLVRTTDKRKTFPEGGRTVFSYALYTITQLLHDTVPSLRIKFSTARYNENILGLSVSTLYENSQFTK